MRYNAGVDLLKAGQQGEAVAEFQEALRLKPGYAEAEDNLGIALTQMPGREGEARGHFEAAVKLDPGSAQAHYNLGVAPSRNSQENARRPCGSWKRLIACSPDAELKKSY